MPKLTITVGQDLSAYATFDIPADTDLSDANLIQLVQTAQENEELVFDEDWATTSALRIVSVKDHQGHALKEDLPVEALPHDAGQVLQLFLKGHVTFAQVVEAAARYKLIDPQQMACHTGTLTLPGAAPISAAFSCRLGATQDERDLAFMRALAELGTVHVSPGLPAAHAEN